MRLSIVIPTYNVENYIAECLDSLVDQGLDQSEYEIIIVNDGATDRTDEIIRTYAKAHAHIHIFYKENGGAGSARNLGMDKARGRYIYFIDADDYLLPNSLVKLIDTAERNHLDILTFLSSSFSAVADGGEPILNRREFTTSFDDALFSSVMTGKEYVAKSNYRNEVWWFLINRNFLLASGIRNVEGRYLEDAIFTLELFLKAQRTAHINLDAHRYRTTPGSAMTNIEPNHYLKVIRDIHHAVLSFEGIIKKLEGQNVSSECVDRVKTKQQALVFFLMIRMLRSTMSFKEIKQCMYDIIKINAYPLNVFLKSDDHDMIHKIIAKLLNQKYQFYVLYHVMNPIIKHRPNYK